MLASHRPYKTHTTGFLEGTEAGNAPIAYRRASDGRHNPQQLSKKAWGCATTPTGEKTAKESRVIKAEDHSRVKGLLAVIVNALAFGGSKIQFYTRFLFFLFFISLSLKSCKRDSIRKNWILDPFPRISKTPSAIALLAQKEAGVCR